MKTTEKKLIGPFTQIITMKDLELKGPIRDDQLQIISDGGILVQDGKVIKIGDFKNLSESIDSSTVIEYIKGETVVVPGFVDAHTHICFAGSRAGDYASRNSGRSYLEIAKAGGGIWSTVQATRKASKELLIEQTLKRVGLHLRNGVTTIEIKSGYGLSIDSELKMLEAIKVVSNLSPVDIISTCLAAHTLPKDQNVSQEHYLDNIVEKLLPKILDKNLAKRVDIFIEQGSFSPELGKAFLIKSKNLGFDLTVHGDQFSVGGSRVAVDIEAVSVDHLEASTEKEIEMIASSNTVAVALPGASMGLGCPFTPARKLLDSGASLAIASDWNPGSAPMGHLLLQASVLGAHQKLTNAEVLAGLTFRAAKALNLSDRGRLTKGQLADFVVFPTNDYQEILYKQGMLQPSGVWKRGIQVL